jgi:hypothetical protein
MPRGDTSQTKVFLQGKEEDFIVFIDSQRDLEAWKSDRSIPLAQVVSGFKIMISHKYDTLSLFSSLPQDAGAIVKRISADILAAGMEPRASWTVHPRRRLRTSSALRMKMNVS